MTGTPRTSRSSRGCSTGLAAPGWSEGQSSPGHRDAPLRPTGRPPEEAPTDDQSRTDHRGPRDPLAALAEAPHPRNRALAAPRYRLPHLSSALSPGPEDRPDADHARVSVLRGRSALHRLIRPNRVGQECPSNWLGRPRPRPPAAAGTPIGTGTPGARTGTASVPTTDSGPSPVLRSGRRRPAARRFRRVRPS